MRLRRRWLVISRVDVDVAEGEAVGGLDGNFRLHLRIRG